MRALNRLSVAGVRSSRTGKHPDGGGLWLHRRADGSAQWFLRVTVGGRRREMGLGGYPTVSLREAREAAAKWRAVAAAGRDPIKAREHERREAAALRPTLAAVTAEAFEARKAQLKGDGAAGRWLSPLTHHVLPRLGRVSVEDLDQNDIRHALAPIWHEKGETARKALGRLSIVLRHAVAMGLHVDLQAAEKAGILLGRSRHKPEHLPALPWADVPRFYASLDGGSTTELALRLLVLTATRSAEVRCCRLDEIEDDVWTIPAERTKTGVVHRVPLSREALATIAEAAQRARGGYLLASRGGVISGATLSEFMRARGMDAKPHGFRTSFRTWAAEATDVPREVAETCLGHVAGGAGKVERVYRRTDFLERRRALMQRWADFCAGRGTGDVVQIVAGRVAL